MEKILKILCCLMRKNPANSQNMGTAFRVRVVLLAALVCGACRSGPKGNIQETLVGWRAVGSFSGRGDSQTESFNIESGQWRIKWATTGAGMFEMTVHSAVSGRPLGVPVEQRGTGHGIDYVNEDPRLYHLVIESSDVDWSVGVEEAVVGYGQSARQLR
jgi:hypothetical protein